MHEGDEGEGGGGEDKDPDTWEEQEPCPLSLPEHWGSLRSDNELRGAGVLGQRLAVSDSTKTMRLMAAEFRAKASSNKAQGLQLELAAVKRALIAHRQELDAEKSKRLRLAGVLDGLKLQRRELEHAKSKVELDDQVAAKKSELREVEARYEAEVTKSLTYQYMADRLESYTQEERSILRSKESKLAEVCRHVDDARSKHVEIQRAADAEVKLLETKQSMLQVEHNIRSMHSHQRERRHEQAQRSVAAMEAAAAQRKAATVEWCREKERELSKQARDAKLHRQEASALQLEYEQGLQRLGEVIGRKTSQEIATRFFECKAQNAVGRQAADELEAKIAALKSEGALLSSELSELTCHGKSGSKPATLPPPAAVSPGSDMPEVDLCLPAAAAAASSPQSASTLMRRAQTRKKDARSIRRPLFIASEESLGEWSEEMQVGAVEEELLHTRFRDMVEMKKNHLSAAQVCVCS